MILKNYIYALNDAIDAYLHLFILCLVEVGLTPYLLHRNMQSEDKIGRHIKVFFEYNILTQWNFPIEKQLTLVNHVRQRHSITVKLCNVVENWSAVIVCNFVYFPWNTSTKTSKSHHNVTTLHRVTAIEYRGYFVRLSAYMCMIYCYGQEILKNCSQFVYNIYNFIRHIGSCKTLNNYTEKEKGTQTDKSVIHSILTCSQRHRTRPRHTFNRCAYLS